MKSNTKKASPNKNKAFAVGSREGLVFASVPYTLEDFKNSLLIVSLLVNASILILWILTQVHSTYALLIAQAIVQ